MIVEIIIHNSPAVKPFKIMSMQQRNIKILHQGVGIAMSRPHAAKYAVLLTVTLFTISMILLF